jgi:hypothetical protein
MVPAPPLPEWVSGVVPSNTIVVLRVAAADAKETPASRGGCDGGCG